MIKIDKNVYILINTEERMIQYDEDKELFEKVEEIIQVLKMEHVDKRRISVIRSRGSSSRNILARCHALPRIMQQSLKTEPFYTIELVSENFDRLSEDDQIKTLIHELLHIPKAFGGGFRHHDFVSRRTVDKFHEAYKLAKKEPGQPVQIQQNNSFFSRVSTKIF